MNRTQKSLVSMLVLAILAFSTGAALVNAAAVTQYSQLSWAQNSLVTPGTLTIYGSSTVGPIATEEINQGGFVNYWNTLVSNNVGWGTASALDLNAVSLAQDGSGTAIPALSYATGSADLAEMSKPPSSGEWQTKGMDNLQLYAVGVDSVAIVVDPTMTWFPTSLTTNQVAQLFVDTTSGTSNGASSPVNSPQITWADGVTNGTQVNQGTQGSTGTTAKYVTWGDFLTAYYAPNPIPSTVPTSVLTQNINRAVRDPTSGTFDCFNNYFAVPNGYQFAYKAPPAGSADLTSTVTTVQGSQEMAPFTYCKENSDIYNTVKAGNAIGGDYIGFISLGYLQTYGNHGANMIGLNIAFNMATVAQGQTSPLIKYYGTSGTQGFVGSSVLASWGSPVTPTDANVIWAYTGNQGSATGKYEAWRWLWELAPGAIPSTGPLLSAGVWISYMMADKTTTTGMVAVTPGTGTSNFVADQNYISLDRDDMAGPANNVIDSNLNSYTPKATQTQTIPDGKVNMNDISYFVTAYIAYNSQHIYNPYADMDANGHINMNDVSSFVSTYIAYYGTYIK